MSGMRARTGVVIGKFYPPHRGHKYLIDTAAGQVERLTVIVCARAGQTIPGRTARCLAARTVPAL